MTDPVSAGVRVEIRFDRPPLVRMITSARRFVEELYEPLVGPDAASRMAMVAHELMENMAKYAHIGPVQLEVEYTPRGEAAQLRIAATNPATPDQLAALERVVCEVSTATDPRAMYLAFMKSSVARSAGSGLGLARIRAEGEMQVRFTRSEECITIYAEASVASGSTP
jgi:two-component sensor histidine kinase